MTLDTSTISIRMQSGRVTTEGDDLYYEFPGYFVEAIPLKNLPGVVIAHLAEDPLALVCHRLDQRGNIIGHASKIRFSILFVLCYTHFDHGARNWKQFNRSILPGMWKAFSGR